MDGNLFSTDFNPPLRLQSRNGVVLVEFRSLPVRTGKFKQALFSIQNRGAFRNQRQVYPEVILLRLQPEHSAGGVRFGECPLSKLDRPWVLGDARPRTSLRS